MPPVRKTVRPVGILTGDWHMSHTAPKARAEKGDRWYVVMSEYIRQLTKLQEDSGGVPIFHSGDLLDTWDQPAELINFLIAEMPFVHGVPGQHDLPNHNLKDLRRSAWWTLVQAGKVNYLPPGVCVELGGVSVQGFPWGTPLTSPAHGPDQEKIDLAVAHVYCRALGHDPAKGGDESAYGQVAKRLEGFDVILTGDNHSGFQTRFLSGMNNELHGYLFNNGTFLRRKADEKDYRPHVGVLMDDGTVQQHFLDTSADLFAGVEEEVAVAAGLDPEELLRELKGLQDAGANYFAACEHFANKFKLTGPALALLFQILRNVERK